MNEFRVGVDIGGTFTDIVFLGADGRVHTQKVSSSVDDYARAIAQGIAQVFEDVGLQAHNVIEILHGTTVASNAILEGKGARTGLITTRGFRDVLELRNLRMPRLYDLKWEKPAPLVERYLRLEVDERINVSGEVLTPLDRADAERAIRRLVDEDVDVIAIALLNSFTNPAHDRAADPGLHQLRGTAGDQGVRAHVDHGNQRLFNPDCFPIPLQHGERARTGRTPLPPTADAVERGINHGARCGAAAL